jgi:hypothetical protein
MKNSRKQEVSQAFKNVPLALPAEAFRRASLVFPVKKGFASPVWFRLCRVMKIFIARNPFRWQNSIERLNFFGPVSYKP